MPTVTFKPISLEEFRQRKLDDQQQLVVTRTNEHSVLLNLLAPLEPIGRLLASPKVAGGVLTTHVAFMVLSILNAIGVPTKLLWPLAKAVLQWFGLPLPPGF